MTNAAATARPAGWWHGSRRRLLLAGAVAVLAAATCAAWWLLRPRDAVLFGDLAPQDAAVLAAELDRQKIPYAIAPDGASLLVDESLVPAVRMKLMGKDLPLRGAVGFELFNGSDLGMTEFAQKVNYQRALQGELTRTILAFPEVREARVHLALPEQGLFRQSRSTPKAAVTLATRGAQRLGPDQVQGLQRLLAASVPGLAPHEVTVIDAHGVAMSRVRTEADLAGDGQMQLKREVEQYLARKAAAVLDHVFGAGRAHASVDVALDMDQVRITTEEVLGAGDGRPGPPSGVLVRERESARDAAPPAGSEPRSPSGSSMQRDAEYQPGRRVEQLVSQPGSIRRLQVVAVVQRPLDAAQEAKVRALLSGAVGVMADRGDTVVVQAFDTVPAASPAPLAAPALPAAAAPARASVRSSALLPLVDPPVLLGALLFVLAAVLLVARRVWKPVPQPARLSSAQRQLVFRQVNAWLEEGSTSQGADAPAASAR